METTQTRSLLRFLKVLDSLVMVGAFGLAYLAVLAEAKRMPWAEFFSVRIRVQTLIFLLLILLVWRLLLSALRLSDLDHLPPWYDEILDAAQATSLCTLFAAEAAIVAHIQVVDPLFLVTLWASSFFLVALSRLIIRYELARRSQLDWNVRSAVPIDTNRAAAELVRPSESNPNSGYRPSGLRANPGRG